jgi:hypothetical protein
MIQMKSRLSGESQLCASIALAACVTLMTGVVHGRLTQRWGPTVDIQNAANSLKNLPSKLGDWELLKDQPLNSEVVDVLDCAGYVNRQYVNNKSGQTVSMAIIVGPPGPTSVHTPEICYSSRAYSLHDDRTKTTLLADARNHSFWTLQFRPNIPSTDRLRVFYAWSSGEVWSASESPRMEFAGKPLLYKLQLASVVTSVANEDAHDPCEEFLAAFLKWGWNTKG